MRLRDMYNRSLLFRISLILTLTTIAFFVIGLFYMSSVVEQVRQKRAMLESRQNIQLNFEEVLAFYSREYTELRKELDSLIPVDTEIVAILEQIELKSKALGLAIKINNVKTEEVKTAIKFVRYRLSFDGNNTQLLAVLDILNDLPVYVEVQNINSAKIDDLDFVSLAQHEIIFDIFVRN